MVKASVAREQAPSMKESSNFTPEQLVEIDDKVHRVVGILFEDRENDPDERAMDFAKYHGEGITRHLIQSGMSADHTGWKLARFARGFINEIEETRGNQAEDEAAI